MPQRSARTELRRLLLPPLLAAQAAAAHAQAQPQIDYLSLAQGAVPVGVGGDAKALGVSMEQALLAIDGDPRTFVLTPRPGGAQSRITFVYRLPAATTFKAFSIPSVLETPSPAQTFVRKVEIAGADSSAEGPFRVLAEAALSTHAAKGQATSLAVAAEIPVRWVRLTLEGGIDVQRDKTFLEFSELVGHGTQQAVPLSQGFRGKWKGRGVLLELMQQGAVVSGCYDREGDLEGTVSGNVLRATGRDRKDKVPSVFVLALGDDGAISGVRSTNGAPFRLYAGDAAPGAVTQCAVRAVRPPGCGSVLHGVSFDFDSATLRPESDLLLDALASGLKAAPASAIVVIGHTSSEGADAYNEQLSQRRAEAVVAALVARGIPRAGLSAQGLGEKQPIADNATEAGRSLNRRVEIACR
ncbi:MAG: OmpA family protein [Ideonella sp.]|nr:OmpA family protein [Ideonella sp.]